MARLLVTGGSGFIGRYLVRRLVAEGHEVLVLSRRAEEMPGARVIVGDLIDPATLTSIEGGCDRVVHLAGVVTPGEAEGDFARAMAVNAIGTIRAFELAKRLGAREVLMASSVYVYDGSPALPWDEETVLTPRSALGASKFAAEAVARTYSECYDVSSVLLRLFTVYGPGLRPASFVASSFRKLLEAPVKGTVRFGLAESARDFIYVDDVVEAFLAAGRWVVSHPGCTVLNIASGRSWRIADVVEMMRRLCHREDTTVAFEEGGRRTDERQGPTRHAARIDRARRELGWSPTIELADGLRRTLESMAIAGSVLP